MREEEIVYPKELPIKFSLLEVENYPLHWHDATEIILVVKGSVDIEIGSDIYSISQGELEIVNYNEVHSIRAREENLLLILNIDPSFFEKYYENAREVFFYADSSKKEIQNTERYESLRTYIALLYYEYISGFEDSKEQIEERLLSLMYFLVNNFHYLFYEEESLREDELELERYHRIVRYISSNYMDKISLQEIADQEFLTSQYLSFKIKNTFGYGFNDFLNLTRVEESIKLLLDTDKNISEIAEEVGFSHVRYYNKHFRMHYDLSPMDYRKKYKLSSEELEARKKVYPKELSLGLNYLKDYLENYERYQHDDRVYKYDIDLKREAIAKFNYPEILDLGDCLELYRLLSQGKTDRIFKELDFKYGLVGDLSKFLSKGDQPNFYYLEELVELILSLGLKPIFIEDGFEEELEAFKTYLSQEREDLGPDVFKAYGKEDFYGRHRELYESRSSFNDGLQSLGDIFTKNLGPISHIARLIDPFTAEISDSDSFQGETGLMTANGLRKASYYGYEFLFKLGQDILYNEEGLVVSRSQDGFQVLVYDPPRPGEKRSSRGKKKSYSINIVNMDADHRIVKYELSKDSGSVYDKWDYLARPKYLGPDYLELLERSSLPEIRFYYAKKQSLQNIVVKVKDRGACLYIFEKVQ